MMPNERSKAQVNLPLKQQTPGAPVEKADDPKKGKEQEAKPTETPAAEPGDKKKDGEDGFN